MMKNSMLLDVYNETFLPHKPCPSDEPSCTPGKTEGRCALWNRSVPCIAKKDAKTWPWNAGLVSQPGSDMHAISRKGIHFASGLPGGARGGRHELDYLSFGPGRHSV